MIPKAPGETRSVARDVEDLLAEPGIVVFHETSPRSGSDASRKPTSVISRTPASMLAVEGFDKGFALPRPHALKD